MGRERIYDHCFVVQECDQLRDECAYLDCGKPELQHEWTVEAYRRNPDLPQPSAELAAAKPHIGELEQRNEELQMKIAQLQAALAEAKTNG